MNFKRWFKNKCYWLTKDRISFFIDKFTFELYWPRLYLATDYKKTCGLYAKTAILFTRPRNWAWDTAFALVFMGFGFGFAWNHCDNPNYDERLVVNK